MSSVKPNQVTLIVLANGRQNIPRGLRISLAFAAFERKAGKRRFKLDHHCRRRAFHSEVRADEKSRQVLREVLERIVIVNSTNSRTSGNLAPGIFLQISPTY